MKTILIISALALLIAVQSCTEQPKPLSQEERDRNAAYLGCQPGYSQADNMGNL